MIAEAENFMRELGFNVVRVRHHDLMAKIEVPVADIKKLFSDDLNDKVSNRLKELGFKWVSIDIQGYKQGNLNKALDIKKIKTDS